MKRLKYRKSSDYTLDIDLENGYWLRVDALYNHDSKRYEMAFYIKENTIDKDAAIETLNNEHITFPGERKTIKTEILRYVSSLLSQNILMIVLNIMNTKSSVLKKDMSYLRKRNTGNI